MLLLKSPFLCGLNNNNNNNNNNVVYNIRIYHILEPPAQLLPLLVRPGHNLVRDMSHLAEFPTQRLISAWCKHESNIVQTTPNTAVEEAISRSKYIQMSFAPRQCVPPGKKQSVGEPSQGSWT